MTGWFAAKVDSFKNRGDVNERRPSLDARPEAEQVNQEHLLPNGAKELEEAEAVETDIPKLTFGSQEVVLPKTLSSFPVLIWREGPKDTEVSVRVK